MKIKTALILCAGFGKRLHPLTYKTPKPLLKINKITLLERTLNIIKQLEIKDVKINTYIFTASEDNFVPKTHSKLSKISNDNVKLIQIQGSDHFFRDLFLDEVIELLADFI